MKALLGISAYQGPPRTVVDIDDPGVKAARKRLGGQLQPLPLSRTRWFLADLEDIQQELDGGVMLNAGQLCRSMRRDGMIKGLIKTRTAGLVALPKRYRGRGDIVERLEAKSGTRSVFDEMFPPSELALLAQDGILMGIGVAEMVEVPGRSHPVMIRHEPEFLQYRWYENRWYYQSVVGLLPITPGDGRWILHVPGGRLNPWNDGLWAALGRAFCIKEHAILNRFNFSSKLANPARVAVAPQGSSEGDRAGFMQGIIQWGINQAFELLPGWEVKLLESNGRGWEVFGKEIEMADLDIQISLAGQIVTVTGGAGFSNADIHETIRFDLIKDTGDALAYTINTQGIPPWEIKEFGLAALDETVRVDWDVKPPIDRKVQAETFGLLATALPALQTAIAAQGRGEQINVTEIVRSFGVPITGSPPDAKDLAAQPPDAKPSALPGEGSNAEGDKAPSAQADSG